MKFTAYPITAKPILKEKVWGGRNLSSYVDIKNRKIGEVWMLSDQKDNNSVITSGILKGSTLREAIDKYPVQILGPKLIKKYGKTFPLLFKFLDTNDITSLQVHPDDSYAKRAGFPAGKTEMWYILKNRPGSSIFAGFMRKETKNTIKEAIKNNVLIKKLKKYITAKKDCFFIPSGMVHTIGKGNVIFEVQRNSDITYRIYDWGRENSKDAREMHVLDGLKSVKFNPKGGLLKFKEDKISEHISMRPLVRCGYFYCDEVTIAKNAAIRYDENKVIAMTVIDGGIQIINDTGVVYSFDKGESILIPYSLSGLTIRAVKNACLIMTEVK